MAPLPTNAFNTHPPQPPTHPQSPPLPFKHPQELAYYRPLSHLAVEVHAGARYCPLTDTAVIDLAQKGLPPAQWEPLVPPSSESAVSPGDATAAAADGSSSSAQQGMVHSSNKRAAAMASAARLRTVLQRLCCGGGGRMQGPGRAMGNRQSPMWLYINHLGWCRCVSQTFPNIALLPSFGSNTQCHPGMQGV
jgi:hypothetical protein